MALNDPELKQPRVYYSFIWKSITSGVYGQTIFFTTTNSGRTKRIKELREKGTPFIHASDLPRETI